MKTIQSYILERLVLSKNKKRYYTSLFNFIELLFSDDISPNEFFSEDTIYNSWLLPYEINGVKQDTNPDKWQDDDISDIAKLLYDNRDTEIDIDIQENKFLGSACDYRFELEWRNSIFKFCWTSTNDIRDKI
jgi:hypothetical protein